MKSIRLALDEMKLAGIKLRTNNQSEISVSTGKIAPCVQQYFQQQVAEKIPGRKNPGRTLCAYTEYDSDHTGDYTFFIGEEVTSCENIPEGLVTLTIPPQTYTKFTTPPGTMPNVVIAAWQKIWQMPPGNLVGTRRYHTDFEVYDERTLDPHNAIVDIYIGVNVPYTY